MRRKSSSWSVLTSLVVAACLASAAQAETVAFWEFNGNNFLADSSGNSHALSMSGTVSQIGDAASFPGGDTGAGVLNATIDLSSYRQVTVSWDQYNNGTPNGYIVFEHSANYNNNPGAILGATGSANLKGGALNYNIDTFSLDSGWQHFAATFNLDAANVADVVRVLNQAGTEIGTGSTLPGQQEAAPASFISDLFNIGARQGGAWGFNGRLDNVKIEGTVPEPGTLVMTTFGLLGLLCYAWRKRK